MSNVNQNLKQRLTIALDSFFERGFAITPLLGNKAPYRDNWQHEEALSRETLKKAIQNGEYILDKKKNDGSKRLIYPKGLGLRTGRVSGGIVAVDLDGASAIAKIRELSGNRDLPQSVAFTSGRVGRCQYIYTVPEQYWGATQTKKFKTGVVGDDGKSEQVELRWDGCQSVLPPSVHPTTGEYKWLEGCAPNECSIAVAPMWLIELMLVDPAIQPQTAPFNRTATSYDNHPNRWSDIDWAKSYLQALAPSRADDYDEWLAVGMALHSVDENLLGSWDAWSQQSLKYKPGVCEVKWKSFKRTGVSIGSLAHMAKSDGWTSPFEKSDGISVKPHRPTNSKKPSVTGDSISDGDTTSPSGATLSSIVTSVTSILEQGLPEWEEHSKLSALQSVSGISKTSFALLVASRRCFCDEVMPSDEQQLERLIDWKNVALDFNKVIPHIASDLLHDGQVLNIDPIMLWQYLFPAVLSMLGSKANLIVGSHQIPAIAWTCIVGESGIGKSRAEGVILAPLKAWQKAEYDRFKTEWAEYKKSLNKKSDDSSAVEPPPSERKFLFAIATIQAVMRRLSEQGQNGSLWARDEIAGLFKSLGQFTAKGEGEGLECLLPMWDGAPAPVDRVQHDDSYHVQASRLSIAGGLQPGVFRKIFSDALDAQGIQARFLFALPKMQRAKRVKGYCYLSDKLPAFYHWVDTQFPHGNIKLSKAADARYDVVYESIGQQAEVAPSPAVRAWMRKLPGQLLRIALALHIIECYHESSRPRHELQVDTLNRAVDMCRYYRSTFEVVQESVSDSDCVSSILLKIWDLAATSPQGLAVRDAYRSIKALARRAKEQGRNVAAYTTDLYYQLEKMGKGSVQKFGRLVRFVAGGTNPPPMPDPGSDPKNPPHSPDDDTKAATLVTVDETHKTLVSYVSPTGVVSPVTQQNLSLVDINGSQIDVQNFPVELEHTPSMENIIASFHPSDEPSDTPGGEIRKEVDPDTRLRNINNGDDPLHLPRRVEIQSWLYRISSVQSADDCMDCIDALNQLPPDINELILSNAKNLLPRFWEILNLGQSKAGSGFSGKVSTLQQQPDYKNLRITKTQGMESGDKKLSQASTQQDDLIRTTDQQIKPDLIFQALPPVEKPAIAYAKSYVKNLITGLWVRTRDGFYGHLGAKVTDGRWWVKSPKSKTRDAESRLYDASDIIPMPSS